MATSSCSPALLSHLSSSAALSTHGLRPSSLHTAGPCRVAPSSTVVVRAAAGSGNSSIEDAAPPPPLTTSPSLSRRGLLSAAAAAAAALPALHFSLPAWAAQVPKGFSPHQDSIDRYALFYPFGWQEVTVKGQDVVFKDVIEPLESLSVNIIKTERADLSEIGSPDEVAKALVLNVLTTPSQKAKVLDAKEREVDGKKYYQFEFTAEAPNFTRHALGTVAIGNGKFYTLTTGSKERRWSKVEEKLRVIVNSFTVL